MEYTLGKQIIDFLTSLPNITDSETQRALLLDAGLDPELQGQISYGKPARDFFLHLVDVCSAYKTLRDGRASLKAILEAAQHRVGREGERLCQTLIDELEKTIGPLEPDQPLKSMSRRERLQKDLDILTKRMDTLAEELSLSRQDLTEIPETGMPERVKIEAKIRGLAEVRQHLEMQKRELEKAIHDLEKQSRPDAYKLVFINAGSPDCDLCDEVYQILKDVEFVEIIRPQTEQQKAEELRKAFEACVLECAAFIVIYGNVDSQWLYQQFLNIRKIAWQRAKNPLPAYILCEPSPEEKARMEFIFRGFREPLYASFSDKAQFRQFIHSL